MHEFVLLSVSSVCEKGQQNILKVTNIITIIIVIVVFAITIIVNITSIFITIINQIIWSPQSWRNCAAVSCESA